MACSHSVRVSRHTGSGITGGREPITEILVDGDIEVVEILKEINANIP